MGTLSRTSSPILPLGVHSDLLKGQPWSRPTWRGQCEDKVTRAVGGPESLGRVPRLPIRSPLGKPKGRGASCHETVIQQRRPYYYWQESQKAAWPAGRGAGLGPGPGGRSRSRAARPVAEDRPAERSGTWGCREGRRYGPGAARRAAEPGRPSGVAAPPGSCRPGLAGAALSLPGEGGGRAEQFRGGRRFRLCGPHRGYGSRARGGREWRAGAEGARGGGAGTPGPDGGPWGGRREAAACPGLGGWGERGGEMDKLTIISGCLFLAADIFAIASIANPDWINTGESAGERRARGGRAGGIG